ncbi:MAG TPA: AraC family transcriptional regulator [Puia sp.]|nr:AraC family transcriptional regulator [Puia sp.]
MKVIQFTLPVKLGNSIHLQEDRLPYFYPHLHRHKEIQITWVINGDGTLIVGNTMHNFQSGDLFVIGANQPHLFKSDPSFFDPVNKKKIHSLNIFFNPTGFISPLLGFPEMLGIKKFLGSSNFGMQASGRNAAKLAEHFLKISNATAGFVLAYFIELLQVMANFRHWRFLSVQALATNITDSEGLRMNEIYRFTMDHFTESVMLEQVASVACLTPQSFCRYFKKHTGKTYVHFLNEVRINEACKRFMESNHGSIANVAYKCGFNSVVSFNRLFKTITTKTPKEFIKTYNP